MLEHLLQAILSTPFELYALNHHLTFYLMFVNTASHIFQECFEHFFDKVSESNSMVDTFGSFACCGRPRLASPRQGNQAFPTTA